MGQEGIFPSPLALLMGCYTCSLTGLCQVFFTGWCPFILLGGEGYQEIVTLASEQTSSDEGLMLKTSASVKLAIVNFTFICFKLVKS